MQTRTSTPSPTSIPSATSTPTSQPTLIPVESENLIAELIKTNGNCTSPCFWKIEPETSNYSDTVAFVDALGRQALKGDNGDNQFYNAIYYYKEKLVIDFTISEKSGVVQSVNARVIGLQESEIMSSDWLAFRPESILKSYGFPSDIIVYLAEGPNGYIVQQLFFSYETYEFFIMYGIDDITRRPSETLLTCPLRENRISQFELWLGYHPTLSIKGYRIEEVTGLSVEEFSTSLIENLDSACFEYDISPFYK
jgi:hypothetical protein